MSVWRRDLESWQRFAPSFFVAALGDPVFYLLGIGYGLGRFVADIDGVPYAVFLAPGIIAFTAMNSATFETTIGSFTRMVEQNTYAAILATPCSVADVVAGDVLWAATKGTIAVAVVLALVAAFGLLASPLAVLLLPLGFAVGLMFAAIGMVMTAKAPSYDFFNYYFTFVFSVMFLFCGVFFPIVTLPAWARVVAWCLPLTHAVNLARALAAGTLAPSLLGEVAWMAVVTAAAFWLAERLVRRRLLV
ncbi:MAG TPA: ABC transporter permease [Candidatus Binatia bacterium]|nr:ABC transporter permease [Candidatus Binatia bacterium]